MCPTFALNLTTMAANPDAGQIQAGLIIMTPSLNGRLEDLTRHVDRVDRTTIGLLSNFSEHRNLSHNLHAQVLAQFNETGHNIHFAREGIAALSGRVDTLSERVDTLSANVDALVGKVDGVTHNITNLETKVDEVLLLLRGTSSAPKLCVFLAR